MLGTIVNTITIVAGSLTGLLLGKGIPSRHNEAVLHAIGLAVILIGLKGALKCDDLLLVIICIVIGTLIGETIQIELWLEKMGKKLEQRFDSEGGMFTRGFVTASLIYCVGAMAIVGSLESGLSGNHQTLFAKSILDGVASIVLASTFGIGVLFSFLPVFFYQGLITVSATFLKPYLNDAVILQMSSVGGLLIMAIGINLLELKKIRIGNMLPAIFLPLVYFGFRRLF